MHIRKYIFTLFKIRGSNLKEGDEILNHLDVLKKLGVCLMQRSFDINYHYAQR